MLTCYNWLFTIWPANEFSSKICFFLITRMPFNILRKFFAETLCQITMFSFTKKFRENFENIGPRRSTVSLDQFPCIIIFFSSGGGGGGFCSSGRSGAYFNGTVGEGGEGGKGFLQGGVGGRTRYNDTTGGFGGGGGGYSGGGSGKDLGDSCGGGGGSFNAGNNQHNDCCYNSAGHGQVTITLQ